MHTCELFTVGAKCNSWESNPVRWTQSPTFYRVSLKTGLYRKAVQVCVLYTSLADFYMRTFHRLQISMWRTAQFFPLTDATKKLTKDAEDFTSSSLYSQSRRYQHSHIFGYKQA